MTEIPEDKILNVKTRPKLETVVELKSLNDLQKLISVGNLVCLYEDEKEKLWFIQNFVYKEQK